MEAPKVPKVPVATEAAGRVEMKIVLDEAGKIERGYLMNFQDPSAEMMENLDENFHAWLKQQGFICRGQKIYECHTSGKIKTDDAGKQIQVDTMVLKKRLLDEVPGFKAYLESKNKLMTLERLDVRTPELALEKTADQRIEPE